MAISFSLNEDNKRFFDPNSGALRREVLEWLETFVSPITKHHGWYGWEGDTWSYEIISTTGITDYNLTFTNTRDAAMFKLKFGHAGLKAEYVS